MISAFSVAVRLHCSLSGHFQLLHQLHHLLSGKKLMGIVISGINMATDNILGYINWYNQDRSRS